MIKTECVQTVCIIKVVIESGLMFWGCEMRRLLGGIIKTECVENFIFTKSIQNIPINKVVIGSSLMFWSCEMRRFKRGDNKD